MRKLKYFLMFILSITVLTSCFKDKEEYLLNGDGPNLVSFSTESKLATNVADGQEYTVDIPVQIVGPTSMNLDGDVTATIVSVTDSMALLDTTFVPAVSGVNYRIDNPTITLKKADNYIGHFKFTMITQGIDAPLAKNPVLYLKVKSASGVANVVGNGKATKVTLNYACYSDLAGTYNATVTYNGITKTYTDVFTKTGVGEYRTQIVGGWTGGLGVGTPGFTFIDVCGVITIPEQNLVDYYSNLVYGVPGNSYVDKATGNIHMEYVVTFDAGNNTYVVDYIKQP